MHNKTSTSTKHSILLRLLVLALIGVTWYALDVLNTSAELYSETSARIASQPTLARTETISGTEIDVPAYDMFKPGNLWSLVSKKRPLSGEAGYTLVPIPVDHGDKDVPMKIAVDISDELQQLVNAAEAADEPLMVSSAYRSLEEQQQLFDDFAKENGVAVAKQYVSPVGASEHHTGLSVDLSSYSDECLEDSDSCSLSQSGAAWLAKNAYKFGFIQRYPEGASEITGVAFEPWHFRFVGKPLAHFIYQSDLTFDEVVEKLAPGYARSRS